MFTELPDKISINSQHYTIDTSFRKWTEFHTNLNKSTDASKVVLDFVYELGLPLSRKSIEAVLNFYMCGEKSNTAKNKISSKSERLFCFEKDESLICAAFKSQYNINLRTEDLHWWQFMSLFNGLTDEHPICKIIGYRAIDLNKVPKEQRAYYRKLKEKYALNRSPHYKSLEERNAAMIAKVKQIQREVNGIG